jgi:chromosome segregation ATPase
VNELKVSAHYTEHKLGTMSQQLEEQHHAILERSEHILEIQKKLQMEHALLQESIEGGMGELQEAANEAQQQLDVINQYQKVIAEKQQELAKNLETEFKDLQQKSSQLDSSMTNLHGSVEDLTEKSMAGQEEAIKGLSELQRIQIEAMQESKHSVKSLFEQAQQHQLEFRDWQSELDKMHHRLVDGTTHMIKAQVCPYNHYSHPIVMVITLSDTFNPY